MATIVVPFRGPGGKQRLAAVSEEARAAIALAMLADVLEACLASAPTVVVTNDAAARDLAEEMGARTVGDPGGGQGAAVTAALASLGQGVALIVNADLPCAEPADLLALACAVPAGGMALVEASDGTTNALGLSRPDLFAQLYGPGSAARFRAHAASLGAAAVAVDLANLRTDVDTVDQLELLRDRPDDPGSGALPEVAVAKSVRLALRPDPERARADAARAAQIAELLCAAGLMPPLPKEIIVEASSHRAVEQLLREGTLIRATDRDKGKELLFQRGYYDVKTNNCRGPNYRYTASRGGARFDIRMSASGQINRVRLAD